MFGEGETGSKKQACALKKGIHHGHELSLPSPSPQVPHLEFSASAGVLQGLAVPRSQLWGVTSDGESAALSQLWIPGPPLPITSIGTATLLALIPL